MGITRYHFVIGKKTIKRTVCVCVYVPSVMYNDTMSEYE